jgi:hypothetical protein
MMKEGWGANQAEVDGETHEMVVHRDQHEALNEWLMERSRLSGQRFSVFDSLFWCRGRDMQVWGYRNLLEAYTKEVAEIWIFCCPSCTTTGWWGVLTRSWSERRVLPQSPVPGGGSILMKSW